MAIQVVDMVNLAHTRTLFTIEVSYQLTFRGPSTLAVDDPTTKVVVADEMCLRDTRDG